MGTHRYRGWGGGAGKGGDKNKNGAKRTRLARQIFLLCSHSLPRKNLPLKNIPQVFQGDTGSSGFTAGGVFSHLSKELIISSNTKVKETTRLNSQLMLKCWQFAYDSKCYPLEDRLGPNHPRLIVAEETTMTTACCLTGVFYVGVVLMFNDVHSQDYKVTMMHNQTIKSMYV